MSSSWISQRFRSAWLSANLPLIVLRTIRESGMSEWEIFASLHRRLGIVPDPRDFHRVRRALLGEGYVLLEQESGDRRMMITEEGFHLLSLLEREHWAMAAEVDCSSGRAPGRRTCG